MHRTHTSDMEEVIVYHKIKVSWISHEGHIRRELLNSLAPNFKTKLNKVFFFVLFPLLKRKHYTSF